MEGDIRGNPGKIEKVVGESVLRRCSKCGKAAGLAESHVPMTIMQKWICTSCGTLNQFEIEFRKKSE